MYNFVFHVLHQLNEFFEGDTVLIWVDVFEEFPNFIWITLQTSHNSVKVSNRNSLLLLLVKQVENLLKILNLVISELGRLLRVASTRFVLLVLEALVVF